MDRRVNPDGTVTELLAGALVTYTPTIYDHSTHVASTDDQEA